MAQQPAREEYKEVYDKRWRSSRNTSDDDILALDRPRRQVEFFYFHYNCLIANTLRELLGDCSGKQLLEIGCGRATSSIFQALKTGIQVTPTDYSEEALKIARKNLEKYGVVADPRRENLFELSFPDGSFDAVISLGVMEHIEKAQEAYEEMRRVLKPGGVMISMNVPEHPDNIQRIAAPLNRLLASMESVVSRRPSKTWLDKKTRSKTADVYRSTLTGEEFGEIVKAAGYSSVRVLETNPFPTIDPLPSFADRQVVRMYGLLLRARGLLMSSEPFFSSERNSRCHFIIATK